MANRKSTNGRGLDGGDPENITELRLKQLAAEQVAAAQAAAQAEKEQAAKENENVISFIPKPVSLLDRFKSKRGPGIAGVETLLTALPILRASEVNDFMRLHPDVDDYWSDEFCFVSVPIIGDRRDQLHMIDEELALKFLSSKRVLRFRLALASKPYSSMFLVKIPSQNLDNIWNSSAIKACELARRQWVQVASRKAENCEGYKVDFAQDADAFPDPTWLKRSLDEIIHVSFNGPAGHNGFAIEDENHPGLLRLTGRKQSLT
jgi:hypothetical protein